MHDPSRDPPEEHYFLPDHSDFPVILWVDESLIDAAQLAAKLAAGVIHECEVVPS